MGTRRLFPWLLPEPDEHVACREQARKDAITICAQGRAIRDLKAQVAELRGQLAFGDGWPVDVRGEGR